MAFYKLFYVIHRRTDWNKLWRWERRIMMPEWYAEREEQSNKALERILWFIPCARLLIIRCFENEVKNIARN